MRLVRLVLAASFTTAMAGCSLLLETVPHRPDSGIVRTDGANADGVTADSSRDAGLDVGPLDVMDAANGDAESDAIDAVPALDVAHDTVFSDVPDDLARDASDVGRIDTGSDTPDVFVFDATVESGVVDAIIVGRDTGGSTTCSSDRDCYAQFCGCGACTVDQVICGTAATERTCALGCPVIGSCPYIDNVVCGCSAGTCVVVSRGGTGVAGTPCTSSTECMSGLLCCYPCGVEGCSNVCTVPDPSGTCPLPI